jgi:hypothetical protein
VGAFYRTWRMETVPRPRGRILATAAVAAVSFSLVVGALVAVAAPDALGPEAAAAPKADAVPKAGSAQQAPSTADHAQPTRPSAPAQPPSGVDAAAVLWTADPAKGPDEVFQSLEEHAGSITVTDDPKGRFGPSFKYQIGDEEGKDRCESKGQQTADGEDLTFADPGKVYYVGWRSLWDPMSVDGGWVAFWQMKHYGSGPGGGPLALRTLHDGKLHLQYSFPRGGDEHIWSTDLKLGEWQSFVIGFEVARDGSGEGWLEFWYNGERQKFTNGATRYPVVLLRPNADYVTNKWGVYRSGKVSGAGTAYLNSAKVGTSYASVAPAANRS